MLTATADWIPNIIMGQDYDRRYLDATIHYAEFGNLAVFFGRDMPVHRHAQYVQIHFIDRGDIHFHMDDKVFHTTGPTCFYTPASVPHSFLTDDDARGHVLTIHQSFIWQLMKESQDQLFSARLAMGICIDHTSLDDHQQLQWIQLNRTLQLLGDEWKRSEPGKDLAVEALVRMVLLCLIRLSDSKAESTCVNSDDLHLFNRFSTLVEEHYQQHWQLARYTQRLGVSESRLNQLCQQISNSSPKKLIHDRMIKEAKRMLTFTKQSASDIGYGLGFSDPAYFSRFFKKHAGITAQNYRKQQKTIL
ncbi:4-hydroxyphenylacetate catabolism regulatory protein HpaA [Spongorhabdus nitratireducens]